jgi:hypothetical protein
MTRIGAEEPRRVALRRNIRVPLQLACASIIRHSAPPAFGVLETQTCCAAKSTMNAREFHWRAKQLPVVSITD